jgi:SET family sugar efflux transporter-like MFS transporter
LSGRLWLAHGLVFVAMGLADAMAAPFIVLFLTDEVRADGLRVAVFLVLAPVSAVVVSTWIGRLSDCRPDRRGVLIATASAGCVSSALTAVVRDYWTFLIITVTLGAAAFALIPQVLAYAREALAGSDRVTMRLSTLRTLFSVAWVAGPPVASALLATGGFTLTYSVTSIVYAAVAAVVVVAFRQRTPLVAEEQPDAGGPEPGHDAPRRIIWLSLAAFVLTWAAVNLAFQALPLLVTRELGRGVENAGLLLGLCAGLEIPLMLGLGLLSTRVPLRWILVACVACEIGYSTLVTFTSDLWPLVAGQLLHATAIAALGGPGITYIQDLLPRHRGRASTLYTNTYSAGALLAGPIVGAAVHTGYRVPYAVGAILSASAVGLLVLAARRRD